MNSAECRIGTLRANSGLVCCIQFCAYALLRGMNSSIPLVMGYIAGYTWQFEWQQVKVKENTEYQTAEKATGNWSTKFLWKVWQFKDNKKNESGRMLSDKSISRLIWCWRMFLSTAKTMRARATRWLLCNQGFKPWGLAAAVVVNPDCLCPFKKITSCTTYLRFGAYHYWVKGKVLT